MSRDELKKKVKEVLLSDPPPGKTSRTEAIEYVQTRISPIPRQQIRSVFNEAVTELRDDGVDLSGINLQK